MENKNNNNILYIILALIVLALGVWFLTSRTPVTTPPPGNGGNNGGSQNGGNNNGGQNDKSDLIVVTSQKANDTIQSPITIEGKARGNWYFEASFPVRIVDANGKVLLSSYMEAGSDWMTTEFVPFKKTLTFTKATAPTGEIILEKDNPSGLPEHANELRIPIKFTTWSNPTSLSVKAYFSQGSPNDCTIVAGVNRTVPYTQTTAKAALTELLKGPTAVELAQGYATNLNPNTKLNSVTITNGVATADFNADLDKNVAGSCRVLAIRSQIENTLKQFPSVTSVVISRNGTTSGVLQP